MWKVLVAEDNIENQEILLAGLKNFADCSVASTGCEAFDLYQKAFSAKNPFDFILLDVTMPEMDGFQVLKAIRSHEEKAKDCIQDSLVIMVTAYRDSLMEKYNMGWDDFITKPVEPKALINHMKNLILSRV
ncbi:MAG: response regulator [Candidatus Omnitrophota bacterium]|jgi:CheY-like chemotaxis protein